MKPAGEVRGLGPLTDTVQQQINRLATQLAAQGVADANRQYIQPLLHDHREQEHLGEQAGASYARKLTPYFAVGSALLVLAAGAAVYKAAT